MHEAQKPKLHAACDICRQRKLKCTGEHPKCSRCERKGFECNYAVQKAMGRPKKRRVNDDLDMVDANPTIVEQTNDREGQELSGNESPVDDGNWFHGRGFGSPLMPNLPPSTWPSLNEAGSICRQFSSRNECSTSSTNLSSRPATTNSSNTPLTTESDVHDHPTFHQHSLARDAAIQPVCTNIPTGCACLSAMYLELSSLQSMTDFSFPSAVHHLRKAIGTACGVLDCEECPKSFFTGFQNIQLLGLFIICVAERYTKVLAAVDAEAQIALDAHEKQSFRMGDLQGSHTHLHSNDPQVCLAAMQIDLEPLQWRSLVKRVIRGEVKGTPIDCCPSLLALINSLKERQIKWHRVPPPIDYPRPLLPEDMAAREHDGELSNCLKLAVEAEKIIDFMNFD